MKSLVVLFTLFGVINIFGQLKSKDEGYQKAEKLLQETVVDKRFKGVVAGFSMQDKANWQSAAGYADEENDIKFTTDTRTRIASIVKSFTALAIMQLYEKGLLDLDKPIQQYIPDYPKKDKGVITVRQLLNHSSGVSAYKSHKETETTKNYETLEEAMSVFQDRPLLHVPGATYSYTTYGYVVLGSVIEKITGMSYEDYIQKNILDIAGMSNTGVEKYGEVYTNKSVLYHSKKKGKIIVGKVNNLSNRLPAGGYYSTIGDLLSFGQAILDHKFVKESTLELMLTNNGLKKEGNPYGFGWYLYGGKENPGGVFGHSGAQTGVSAQFLIIPKRKSVSVVLANTSGEWEHAFGLTAQLSNLTKEMNDMN
jgi:CubicO group peptidase (beta-lactamase class C family)